MNYRDILENAKRISDFKCKVCPECNGKVCKGEIPGVGGKGSGSAFIRNVDQLKEIKLNMDTLYEASKVDSSIEIFGKRFKYPIFAAPIGGLIPCYGEKLTDYEYSKAIVAGCKQAGTIGFTGDGVKDEYFMDPLRAIEENDSVGIPTIKPWKKEEVLKRLRSAEEKNVVAVAMDIDAAGLAILAQAGKPVSPKSVDDLKEIIDATKLPFIIKGIMTVKGARKAMEAGAHGIVVSNHGGRVLDHTLATVEVLPQIVAAVKGRMKIFIDGGIRNGLDVLKVLALGADAVLIGRPYAVAAYGGGSEGVALYTEKIGKELVEGMIMTGCNNLKEINQDIIFRPSI
ncbi:alpha-hydroxy-acid oxidizing protein [Marinisporobacter balticus]|uniref:L-lactate oxidase n=1 Tax=Marinisporobacter balticus TaxID=2018667 RepID=A0A4R2KUJ1_9FIRM|nr:alpha-hydroxy-acid oxidizing protein [Marinisporobacter balticus]TCO77483.1 isopentenyl diphosphate isomerase/L-lactate dehydrogenase-like FMN-dependent dehydrogenase [Marinisporobacter balticus]